MKPKCYACRTKRARVLDTRGVHYQYAAREPVFCSYRCAADYGLLAVGPMLLQAYWCEKHGEWSDINADSQCGKCADETPSDDVGGVMAR